MAYGLPGGSKAGQKGRFVSQNTAASCGPDETDVLVACCSDTLERIDSEADNSFALVKVFSAA